MAKKKKARKKAAKKKTQSKVTAPTRPNGRPTKYKKVFCDKLIAFFDIEPWQEREIPHYKAGMVVWTDIKILPVRMPTLRRFAKSINVGIRTLYDWLDSSHRSFKEDFSHAFTHAQEIRKDWLIDAAISGAVPPASFKFIAVNVTDMRDRQDFEHSGEIRLLPPKVA